MSDIFSKIKLISNGTLTLNLEDIKLIADTLEGLRINMCKDADTIQKQTNTINKLQDKIVELENMLERGKSIY